MKKQVHKINGFIDTESVEAGKNMVYVNNEGKMAETSRLLIAKVYGSRIYAETENDIYINYNPVRNRYYKCKELEEELVERYYDSNKDKYALLSFDMRSLCALNTNDNCWYLIEPEQIKPGMSIGLGECKVLDMETGDTGMINGYIKEVKNVFYKNGALVVESRSSVFSTIDFSKELQEIRDLLFCSIFG